MNKEEVKNIYLLGAYEGLLRNAAYSLPSSVKRKDWDAFREKMLQEMADAQKRADAYAAEVCK